MHRVRSALAAPKFPIFALYVQVALAVACQNFPPPSVDSDEQFVQDADHETVA